MWMSEDSVLKNLPFDAEADNEKAIWAHVVPFVAWLFIMHMLGDPAGWKYALRTALCAGIFLAFRPWRWYPAPRIRCFLPAFAVGVAVFFIWVFPETRWFARFPALQDFYLRYLMLPFGKPPDPLDSLPYAPENAGWTFALIRLAGSAFVIAVIEEFFWRSFLYRWMLGKFFLQVNPRVMHVGMLLMVSLIFGVEHARWFVGFLAGLAYGWFYIRTGDVWAVSLAHVVTNFILGWYVLATGSYAFW
jgi:uncharacterized protein